MRKHVQDGATALYPLPVVLVSCGVEHPNIITLAWAGTLCSLPPTVGIAVRPSRHSHGLIQQQGAFVVNLPPTGLVEAVDICGTISGRDEDKFHRCGLTPTPAVEVPVPLIAECPIHLECVVRQTLSLGSHDLFLGEVVAVQANEDLLDEQGHIDYARAGLLTYLGGSYYGLGARVARHGFSEDRV